MSYSYGYSSRQQPRQQPQQKPTIKKPGNAADCRLFLKRTDTDLVVQMKTVSDLDVQMKTVSDQIASLQKQLDTLKSTQVQMQNVIKQTNINKIALTRWVQELEKIEAENIYINKCKDFINKYEWMNPEDENEDEDDDDDDDDDDDEDTDTVSTLKKLPVDIFEFLNSENKTSQYNFRPISEYTSDEIQNIAHYLKACELLAEFKTKFPERYCSYDTYYKLIDSNYDRQYDSYILGDIENCDGSTSDDHEWCHKRFAQTITKFEYIELDMKIDYFITYSRVN
jgi:hypothetical protein